MFKNILCYFMFTLVFACNGNNERNAKTISASTAVPPVVDPSFIPIDTSERMIGSYVASLGPDTLTKIHSWSLDADALRKYLQDPSITDVSIALSHTMTYINNGNYGVPSGFSPSALTVIIAGQNSNGERIPYQDSYLLDRAKPCPPICLSARTSKRQH